MCPRIYAVADIHGKQNRLDAIRKNVERCRPSVLILAGDITGYTRVATTIEAFESMSIPILFVRGNTDRPCFDNLMTSIPTSRNLHLSSVQIGKVKIVGVSGTLPLPFHSKIRFHEAEIIDHLASLLTNSSILVCHPPPLGVCDLIAGRYHAGSRIIRKLIMRHKPAAVICGHIHEARGSSFLDGVCVVNCAMSNNHEGVLMDIPDDFHTKLTWLPRLDADG